MIARANLSCRAQRILRLVRETAALSGHVTSAGEGAMEGVLSSAKEDGSTITTTVVSDAGGSFRFPASRLRSLRAGAQPPI